MSKYFFDSSFIIALALDNDSNKSKALELTDLLSEECYIGDNVIEEVVNVVRCKNPRCITSIEQELENIFVLTDPRKEVYRCKWCEEKYRGRLRKEK